VEEIALVPGHYDGPFMFFVEVCKSAHAMSCAKAKLPGGKGADVKIGRFEEPHIPLNFALPE
jgi:hypothetical protein